MVAYDTRCGIEAEAAGRRCHEMDLSGPSHMHLPLPCLSMHAVHVAHRSQCKRQCVGLVCPCPAFSAIWEIEPCRGSDSVASCALLRLLFVKAGGPLRSDIDPLPPHAHVNLVSGQITRLFPWSHLSLVMYVVAFLFCGYPSVHAQSLRPVFVYPRNLAMLVMVHATSHQPYSRNRNVRPSQQTSVIKNHYYYRSP